MINNFALLDIRTLIITLAAISLLGSLTMLFIHIKRLTDVKGTFCWFLGPLLLAIGVELFAFQAESVVFVTMSIAVFFILFSVACLWQGVRAFVRSPYRPLFVYGATSIVALVFLALNALMWNSSVNVHIGLMTFSVCAVILISAVDMWRIQRNTGEQSISILVYLFFVATGVYLWRGIMAFTEPPRETFLSSGGYTVIFFLFTILFVFLFIILLISIINERLSITLSDERNQLLAIFDSIDEVLYLSDPNTYELVYYNKAFADLYGEGKIGEKCHKVIHGKEDPCNFCTNPYIFGKNLGSSYIWEMENRKNGRWFRCIDKAVQWTDGRYLRYEMAIDITDQKQNEVLRDDIERVVKHDMKTPLNAILGFSKMMEEGDHSPEDHRRLSQYINQSGEKMLFLIQSSLDIYKMAIGTYELEAKPFDFLRTIREVERNHHDLLAHKDVRINYRISSGERIPPDEGEGEEIIISGEEQYIHTMYDNLFKNAVEASPSGRTVTVSIETGGKLLISIHNEGTIPEAIRKSFFSRYTTAGKKRGTGLGTYSAKLIARVHGGDITFRSNENEGTTVTIDLPGGKVE